MKSKISVARKMNGETMYLAADPWRWLPLHDGQVPAEAHVFASTTEAQEACLGVPEAYVVKVTR